MATDGESIADSNESKEPVMTLDDYIETLKSELVSPKRPYEFKGLYDFLGKEHAHKGNILIDRNLNFAGEIYDRSSRFKKHAVKGKITIEENRMVMNFAKIPPGFMFNTIYYCLEKEGAPKRLNLEGLSGNYLGQWNFNEEALDVGKREEPGIGTALNIKPAEQSNKAGISLHMICPDIYQGWHYYFFQKY
jgi:hypothetical protein